MSRMIALWGNSGSYKTATAAKLALQLSKHGSTLLVSLNTTKPSLPVLLPKTKEKSRCSLGRILAGVEVTKDSIYQNIELVSRRELGVIAYRKGENIRSYAEYTTEKALYFLTALRSVASYIVIDCTTALTENLLTDLALQQSDMRLCLCTADPNGLSFFSSQFPLLANTRYHGDAFTKALALPPKELAADINGAVSILGDVPYLIPYSLAVRKQMQNGTLFERTGDSAYQRVIDSITKDVITDER